MLPIKINKPILFTMLLITGAKGQLGTELSKLFPDSLHVDLSELDITDAQAVRGFVHEHRVDTIINGAAYTAVDHAEDEPELARKINVDGVRNLAQTAATLIHISTDYVFDGMQYRPYVESDPTSPTSIYGKTKLEGEQVAMEFARTALVLRTSWLYSPYGNNFVKTMRRLGAERDVLNVVADQVGTPTSARSLAQAIAHLLPQITLGTRELYHYSNEGVCSWYDFACEVMKESGLSCSVQAIESKDYPTKAARPFYSVLNKARIKTEFSLAIPHWQDELQACINELQT